MAYIVGDLITPNKKTDTELDDFEAAYELMTQKANEVENFVVGLWSVGNDYAEYVAINGEVFRAD